MTTTTATFTQLAERAVIRYIDPEAPVGTESTRVLAPGAWVLVQGVTRDGDLFVDGIARPTSHGGGVHVKFTDPDTGLRGQGVVRAWVL